MMNSPFMRAHSAWMGGGGGGGEGEGGGGGGEGPLPLFMCSYLANPVAKQFGL